MRGEHREAHRGLVPGWEAWELVCVGTGLEARGWEEVMSERRAGRGSWLGLEMVARVSFGGGQWVPERSEGTSGISVRGCGVRGGITVMAAGAMPGLAYASSSNP